MADEKNVTVGKTLALDRSRYFGEVFPPLKIKSGLVAKYAQDGFHFTAHGVLIEEMLTDDDRKRLTRTLVERRADDAAMAARKKVLVDSGMSDDEAALLLEDAAARVEAQSAPEDPKEVDLLAYFMGTKKYIFGQIQGAMKAQYGYAPTGKKSAIEFMIEEGHMEADDIKISAGG